MTSRYDIGFGTITIVVLCVITPALAQPGGDGTVSATGMVQLKRQANILRATIELTAQGDDLKTAVANLAAEREGARSKLASLGAIDKSVEIGNPAIGSAASNDPRLRQYQQAYAMARGRTAARATTQPSSTMVSATVQAEWELRGATPDELLIGAHELQKQIKDEFATSARAISPEEQELLEEMRGSGMVMPDQANPGEPKFVYVHRISDEDYEKAIADAFGKARVEAGRLAVAAGKTLGEPRQLSVSAAPGATDTQYMYQYDYNYYQAISRARGGVGESGAREAIGTQPGSVSLSVSVTAAFALK